MKLVTGGAGFIGSHLVDALLEDPDAQVRVVDNLSTGHREFLAGAEATGRLEWTAADCLQPSQMAGAMDDIDEVWHMAADPDVRRGATHPWENFRDGAVATFHTLDAARKADVERFVLASTSTVYGEATVQPTPESYGPMLPISMYGAAKLAAEAVATAFSATYGIGAWIFRFGNVVGPRSTHGVVHDFARKLGDDATRLEVLGDGRQAKSYLWIEDCVSGMLDGVHGSKGPLNVFNLSTDDQMRVSEIAQVVCDAMDASDARIEYSGSARGWPGDVVRFLLDCSKMNTLGWKPVYSSRQAIEAAAALAAHA